MAKQVHKQARHAVLVPLEVQTHVAVADALRIASVPGWLWSHFPAGENRDSATGAKLQRMGLKRGWSDFVLISPSGVHHWLELKRGTRGKLKPEQSEFALHLLNRGVPWAVAYSFDEAVRILTGWGALKMTVSA